MREGPFFRSRPSVRPPSAVNGLIGGLCAGFFGSLGTDAGVVAFGSVGFDAFFFMVAGYSLCGPRAQGQLPRGRSSVAHEAGTRSIRMNVRDRDLGGFVDDARARVEKEAP